MQILQTKITITITNFINKNVSWLHFSLATQYIGPSAQNRLLWRLLAASGDSQSERWKTKMMMMMMKMLGNRRLLLLVTRHDLDSSDTFGTLRPPVSYRTNKQNKRKFSYCK